MIIQAPKGTRDVLPAEAYKWHYIENKVREIAAAYGYREIRTPVFEHTELFLRGIGETTDVVQKEMYTFNDKGNRSITLKPEGTAPAVRSFIENSLYNEMQPTKMYYITPVFRYENVQKGRLREHHQFGVEQFGSQDASIDAEIISLAMRVFTELGITSIELNINNIGCPKCRKTYNDALKAYLRENYDDLCETCKTRFEKNPMRILDCKEDKCKRIVAGAPVILDYICEDCSEHFEDLKKYLEALGIAYKIDPLIVRGLDYYSKTVFEIINDGITVCGGGRYDYLIEEIDGPHTPAMGFGMGIERLILTLEQNNQTIPCDPYIDIYVGSMGDVAKVKAMQLVHALRQKGLKCECDHMDRSVKSELKYANKIDAQYALVIGEDELKTGKTKLKRMRDGELFDCDINDLESIKML
ncbi:MAG: histidine--tRNA ligase [Clostridiaceae bacterium]